MDGLKRLEGAKTVAQDDFQKGTGVYIVSYEAVPKTKIADIKKELGKYKLVSVGAKITSKVTEKDKKFFAGDLALENPKDDDILKTIKAGESWVLSGALSEDDKGNRTLTLSKAVAAK